MAQQVFISYARGESAVEARALRDTLGPEIAFLDEHDLDVGSVLPVGIAEALLGARVVVVFAGERYFKRWYCLREFNLALAPHYRALVDPEAGDERRAETLSGIVVALAPEAGNEVLDELPPGLRTTLWHSTGNTIGIAGLVRDRLAIVASSLGERLAAEGLQAQRNTFLEQAAMPPARNLANVPMWAPPGEPADSLHDGFVGRVNELWTIHHALSIRRGGIQMAGLTGSLEGGGGFGKTRLAAEYLHRFGPTFYPGALFWVRADLELVPQLHGMLSNLEPGVPDLKAFAESGRDAWAELGGALEKRTANQAVLYVVDNVPEPRQGEAPRPLSTWCPALGKVSLLVTSRATQSLTGAAMSLRVDVLDAGPAVALLTRNLDGADQLTDEGWKRIAQWVGHLPLALEILNASLRAGALHPQELLDRITTSPVAELDRAAGALEGVVPEGSLRGITEALVVSYEKLVPEVQQAACLLARLAPAPIPLVILEALGEDLFSPSVRAILRSRSLLAETGDGHGDPAFLGRMHPVLADFLRSRASLPTADLFRVCHALTKLLDAERSSDPRSWPLMNACLPHAEEVFRATVDSRVPGYGPAVVRLGIGMAALLSAQGLTHRASEVDRKIIELATESEELGPDHPETLMAMNNLAMDLTLLGDLLPARELQEQVLEARRRVLGEEHPDTLRTMNDLARTLSELGELLPARQLHEQVLEARRRVLGEEHPDTLRTMNDLAVNLHRLGDIRATRALQEQVLEALRNNLGEHHLDTIRATGNLATTLYMLGDRQTARQLQEHVLDMRLRLLGEDHPDTVQVMINLAVTLTDLGDRPAARAVSERSLEASKRIWGNDHPTTVTAMNTLASILFTQGEFLAARALMEQILETSTRLLGPDHANTLTAANNLASTLRALGELVPARNLQEQALEGLRRVLGEDHHSTLIAMGYLASTLRALGELVPARNLQEQALEGLRRAFGEGHPLVLRAGDNLAWILRDAGELPAARAMGEEILEASRQILGENHPDTTVAAWNLFQTLRALDEEAAARKVLEDILAQLLDQDPNALTARQREIALELRGVYGSYLMSTEDTGDA